MTIDSLQSTTKPIVLNVSINTILNVCEDDTVGNAWQSPSVIKFPLNTEKRFRISITD